MSMVRADMTLDLNSVIERLMRLGPSEAMRQDELAIGFEPIRPGERDWFPAREWGVGDVVSVKGREIRIVAIKATQPGTGAFSRMITGIAKAGLTPLVVEPLFGMPEILRRWCWKSQIIGSGFERQEVWRPRVRWLQARAALSSPPPARGDRARIGGAKC